jgi:Phage Tail Collar Domain
LPSKGWVMRRVTFLAAGGAAALAGCGRAAQMLPSGASNVEPSSSQTSAHLRSYFPARPLPKNPILGEVRRFDGKKPPREWSFCDGSILAIAGHRQLFSILGKTFGGDGKKTFALPNSHGPAFVISTGGKFITSPKQLAAAFALRKSR